MRTDEFFAFARERHAIWSRRHHLGQSGPWTDDPILKEYSFTNIYRELDKTTIWFRENIRDRYKDEPAAALFSTVAFRWFNRIETGQRLLDWDPDIFHPDCWDPVNVAEVLLDHSPWITAAYIIKTPDGKNKLDGVLWCIENIRKDLGNLWWQLEKTGMHHAWKVLLGYPYMGPFMAYEVITDLRYTSALDPWDRFEWANPGPGCRRGLARLHGLENYNRFNSTKTDELLEPMRELLSASKDEDTWPYFAPVYSPPWEMREVEHTLCEWDKYERARLGQGRPKQKFTSAA